MVKKMNVEEIKNLITSLRQSDPSLVNLQSVCDKLNVFVEKAENEINLSSRIDALNLQIQQFHTINRDLNNRMGNVEAVLSNQRDQLFLTDQEYRGLLKQVQTVLVSLEDYLRRHA